MGVGGRGWEGRVGGGVVQCVLVGVGWGSRPAGMRGGGSGGGWGALPGLGAAAIALAGRFLVSGMGGFVPASPFLPPETGAWYLAATAWLPALVEEPVLRGALPALARPLLGWWGAALLLSLIHI